MEERGGDPHQRVEERGDPQCRDHQVLEMVFCSSEMEMKSKISIIIRTGFRQPRRNRFKSAERKGFYLRDHAHKVCNGDSCDIIYFFKTHDLNVVLQ